MAKPYYRLLIPTCELQPHCTLDDVAKEIGITHERVRQIETKALRKLRRALAERGYRVTDLIDLNRPMPEERP